MIFRDRHEAGRLLAKLLSQQVTGPAMVYALPRGGVPVGVEVARLLRAPLELVIPRKIGHPHNPEYAVCAVTESGTLVCNADERARLEPDWLEARAEAERREAKRRRGLYGHGHARRSAHGQTAVIVDDGIATGLTMLAALRDIRQDEPKRIIVAVPVAPMDTVERFERESALVLTVNPPEDFLGAIGAYYEDFSQLSDEEVLDEIATLASEQEGKP